MSHLISRLLVSGPWLRERLVTAAIAAGGMALLGACLYRVTVLDGWTADEALAVLWPAYLAGALALLLGWLSDWKAS
jgi:hypothetical protein